MAVTAEFLKFAVICGNYRVKCTLAEIPPPLKWVEEICKKDKGDEYLLSELHNNIPGREIFHSTVCMTSLHD